MAVNASISPISDSQSSPDGNAASQTGLYEGDRIRLEMQYGEMRDLTVERFRDCLGVFLSLEAREAMSFTPLCELYGHGTGSENGYVSNYGEYVKSPVPLWMQIPRPYEVVS